ncbi:hypothetical protein BV898_05915 [Hypsibius exemplaris]|uniref:Uncharacterized protein n=1 Tax=Hypsibius exemplaris TaxID=2072580 RepID=A0A1W0WYC8_HYPEX|nr:hypothetical protein BV898_05915 [Hypsibius exemplaris]
MDASDEKLRDFQREKDAAVERADAQELRTFEAEARAERAEDDARGLREKIQQLEYLLEEKQVILAANGKAVQARADRNGGHQLPEEDQPGAVKKFIFAPITIVHTQKHICAIL